MNRHESMRQIAHSRGNRLVTRVEMYGKSKGKGRKPVLWSAIGSGSSRRRLLF